MTNLATKPSDGQLPNAYAPGVLDQYNTQELDQIDQVREAGKLVSKSQHQLNCEVVRLKLMLDGQDQADGLSQNGNNGRPASRFWDGARAGHFGEEVQGWAEKDDRKKVARLIDANNAAAILLGSSVAIATKLLPLDAAKDLGIGHSALEIYGALDSDAREVADFYYEARSELRADMLKKIRLVCSDFPDRKPELLQGLVDQTIKYPSHIDELVNEWIAQRREIEAVRKSEEHAARLAEAEQEETKLETYKPEPVTIKHVGDQLDVEDVTRRIAPSRQWFDTDSGQTKVKQVVGDLAKPLPDLLTGLTGLNKQLIDQAESSGVMHNYAEFWAGYDRFAMSPAAAKRTWGSNGRLERMRKLRGLLIEVQQRIDMYIQSTTPPENIEYPES